MNGLQFESSPYLRQHAANPVDWYAWGDEAFKKANEERKPIFLSIGYSTCHWCHVMERESFEDEAIAALLNERFVSIKVDREERPDIDRHFQDVYQALNSRGGGWPTSIFLTHDAKPFYAATYLPPVAKHGLPSFDQLLRLIGKKYEEEHEKIEKSADSIKEHLHSARKAAKPADYEGLPDAFLQEALRRFDSVDGGFGAAPKFPQAGALFALCDHMRLGDESAKNMLCATLDAMTLGGFYDIVDGGFCRYSTDEQWLVPHFEKMLYDNALLVQIFVKAYAITKDERYGRIVTETLDFLLDKMCDEDGLFFAASDADTAGHEGSYFVYSQAEFAQALGFLSAQEFDEMRKFLGVSRFGNFEGSNIMRKASHNEPPRYAEAIAALREARRFREYPFIDRKIITAWNAMAVTAFFQASVFWPKYSEAASRALRRLTERLYRDGKLFHTLIGEEPPKVEAFLEDFAYLTQAFVAAYQTTFEQEWLQKAAMTANDAVSRFYRDGAWRFGTKEFETVDEPMDMTYPSSTSVMLHALMSLEALGVDGFEEIIERTLKTAAADASRYALYAGMLSSCALRKRMGDVTIKADAALLRANMRSLSQIKAPFAVFVSESIDGFTACDVTGCFAHTETIEELIKSIR